MKNTKQGELPTQDENPNGLFGKYQIKKIVKNPKHNPNDTIFRRGWRGQPDFTQPREPEHILENISSDSEYFVLRLDDNASDPKHLAACRIAIHAYAEAIKEQLPVLAADLIERYPLI